MARGQIEKRGQRRRKLKPVILIVTEGSQTEPKYFEHYRSRQTNIDIRVVGSHTKGGETDYLALIRKAVEYQSKNQLSVSNGDAVWVVADGDVNYNTPDPMIGQVRYILTSYFGLHIRKNIFQSITPILIRYSRRSHCSIDDYSSICNGSSVSYGFRQ